MLDSAPIIAIADTHGCADVPYYWEDISNPFPDIGNSSLTRLTFSKQMAFADSASAQHFNRKKREFIRMNRRDIHYGASLWNRRAAVRKRSRHVGTA